MRWALLAISAGLSACGAAREPAHAPATAGQAAAAPSGPATESANEDRFYSPVAGVSIVKSSRWFFGTLEMELANRKAVSVGRPDTDAAMHDGSTPPLVVISRYEEPSEKPNPTLKINLRQLGELRGASAVNVARAVAEAMGKAIPSFGLDGAVQKTLVSGLDAGTFRAHFTLEVPHLQRSFPIKTQAWIVPRGDFGFIVTASDPSGGAGDYEADFQAMVATIEIRKYAAPPAATTAPQDPAR
jgi:hypothetical protein